MNLENASISTKENKKAKSESSPWDMYFERKDRQVSNYVDGKVNGKKTVNSGSFKASASLFDSLKLESNGFVTAVDKDTLEVALGVVPDANAIILGPAKETAKKGKGQSFRGKKLEAELIAGGVIPSTGDCKIYLKLSVVGELNGVTYYKVTKDESK